MQLSGSSYAPRSLLLLEKLVSAGLQMLPLKHGKHRLLDRIMPRPIGDRQSCIATSFQGASLRINVDDLVGWHLAMLGSFDPEISEVLLAASGNNDVFWDVGANKGAVCYAIAAALPESKVVAIEPQSNMSANLEYNLSQLCPGRFELHSVGLSNRTEIASLTVPDDNLGSATLHAERTLVHGHSETINLVTATELVERSLFGWPTLAKIDVEGHEPEVFETLSPCLEDGTCRAIVFENHATSVSAFESISALARRHGYRIFGIRRTPFSTRLVSTAVQVKGITDYMAASPRLLAEGGKILPLITSKTS